MKTREQEIEIYKAYLESKGIKNYTINDVCKKMNIARGNLYLIVKRIEKGNEKQLKRCLESSRSECVWRYRYQQRALVIEEYEGKKYYSLLKQLIKDMRKDGLGVREIGRFLVRKPSSIIHYLK